MSDIDDLLASLPLDRISADLGEDPAAVEQAARAALPALIGGLDANAQDPAGAASLLDALGQHEDGDPADLSRVDTADGEKIAAHIFGNQQDQVINQLGSTGASSGLVKKLLPILAPIVLSWLASRMTSKGAAPSKTEDKSVLGSVLEQVLKGAIGGGASGGAGKIISDVLGGLLGGGRR
ncbi:DUF937 domain-containing protein [Nocardioides sp. Root151]|uniref:DUF937 domain-containing protein n=1 Tax=Nocardioides sp. Root151 TaxID=1736475 RepID=UPI0007031739|nr:DUF937 domain-containing protein [Nocardioides sp. Root151]KQZ67570.1 hypothetical protein ASD66_21860 [Nocardioides sp. Root151]